MKEKISNVRGFSLIEVLVACAVFALLAVAAVGITDGTAQVTKISQQRLDADAEGRRALDRFGADISRAIWRTDLPPLLEKKPGNDRLTFFAQSSGYDGDRGVSQITYDASEGKLRRAAQGTEWDAGSDQLAFSSQARPPLVPEEYDVAGTDVLRFEMAFLMGDGRILSSPGSLLADRDASAADKVRAIIVAVVVLNEQTRERLSTGEIALLESLFQEAQDGSDVLAKWKPAMESDSLPQKLRNSLRIYQRYYYLGARMQTISS